MAIKFQANRRNPPSPQPHVDENRHVHGRVRNQQQAPRPRFHQPSHVNVSAIYLPLYSVPSTPTTTPARFGDTQGFYRNGCWYNSEFNREPISANNQQLYLLVYVPSDTNIQPVQIIRQVPPIQGSSPPQPQPQPQPTAPPTPPPPPPQFVVNRPRGPVNYVMTAQPPQGSRPVYAQYPQAQPMYAMPRATVPSIPEVQTLPHQAPSQYRPTQIDVAPRMMHRGVQVPPHCRRPSFRQPLRQNPAPQTIGHAPSRMHLPGAGGHNLPSQNLSTNRPTPLNPCKGQSDPAPVQMSPQVQVPHCIMATVEPEVAVSRLNGPSGTIDSDRPAQAVTVVERQKHTYESDVSMEEPVIKAVQNVSTNK